MYIRRLSNVCCLALNAYAMFRLRMPWWGLQAAICKRLQIELPETHMSLPITIWTWHWLSRANLQVSKLGFGAVSSLSLDNKISLDESELLLQYHLIELICWPAAVGHLWPSSGCSSGAAPHRLTPTFRSERKHLHGVKESDFEPISLPPRMLCTCIHIYTCQSFCRPRRSSSNALMLASTCES